MPEYAVLIYAADSLHSQTASHEELAACDTHAESLRDSGKMRLAYVLTPRDEARSMRATGTADEPYAADHPVVAGFYVVTAADPHEALELARHDPAIPRGGGVEVRPVHSGGVVEHPPTDLVTGTERPGNAEIARDFLAAWAAGDADRVGALLADDVVFESPLTTIEGRDQVAGAMLDFAKAVTSITMIAVAADPDGALAMYDMHTGPFGTIRVTERYEIRDGAIVHDRLVFDTALLHAGRPG